MLSQTVKTVIRTRNEINQKTLSEIEQSIQGVITTYKDKHNGIFDGFTYSNTFDILGGLEDRIKIIIQSKDDSTPFIKYVEILRSIYSVFGTLDAELELNLIYDLQNILIQQLQSLKEADWEEKKRDERYKSEDLDGRIAYCLNRLNDAMYFSSKSEQSFCDKWKVHGSMNDYYVWLHLLANFKLQIDAGYLTRLLSELRHRFGLPETQTGVFVDANNPIYGVNVNKQNHYKYIYMFPASVMVPKQKNRESGVLYLKKNNDNKIEVYGYDADYPQILNEKECNALILAGMEFSDKHVLKIADSEKIKNIVSICRLRVGYFEKMVKDAEDEIIELQKKHACLAFDKQQKQIVDTINCGRGDELKKAIYLIKNKDSFGKTIKAQIKLLEGLDEKLDKNLDEHQQRIFNKIRSALTYQLKLYDLQVLIDKVKRPISSSNTEKMELIREIKHEDSVFTEDLQLQVDVLAEQLSIWSLENLIILCNEYLKEYAMHSHDDNSVRCYDNPARYLSEKFISPVIENLINPLRYILGKKMLNLNISEVTSDLEHAYREYLENKKISDNSVSGSVSRSRSDSESASTSTSEDANLKSSIHLIKSNNVDAGMNQQLLDAKEAVKCLAKLVPEKVEYIHHVIANNDALRMALSAGYLYMKAVKGYTHRDHGEEATILFINNILNLKDKSFENIQKEAIDFIKGQGKDNQYGTLYGGASSHHRHSRISFIIDSGLFDNLKGVIFPYKTTTKNRFFDHQNTFANLKPEDRKELTMRVKML